MKATLTIEMPPKGGTPNVDGPRLAGSPPTARLEVANGIWIEVERVTLAPRVRAALAWPLKVPPHEWAETYRYLTKTAIPGPWRNTNAPYLPGIMHLASCPGVEWLTVQKAVQLGVSEGARTMMGYWAHMDPAPMGLALPNKEKGEQIVRLDVIPMFKNEFKRHPELRVLLSSRLHDMKKGEIRLDNDFLLYLMWSGSAASMASNPMKRVLCDEVNKFAPWTGDDADPISLTEKRTRTYADRLLWLISSPTTAQGQITVHLEQAHVRVYFLVACPHCGCRQRLIFGEGGPHGVKFSDECRRLRKIGRHEAAGALAMLPEQVWYQCYQCQGRIDERQRRVMCRAGVWGTVGDDGVRGNAMEGIGDRGKGTEGENTAPCPLSLAPSPPSGMWDGGPIADVMKVARFPAGTKVGMQIGSLACVWESWTMAHVAAEFLQARTLQQRMAFRTSTLGEPWQQAVERIEIDDVDALYKEPGLLEEGVVPGWAARLIATVDTQQDHFWLLIRAWGGGMRSSRVWHGRVETFADLERLCWKTPYRNADPRLPARICDKVLIDTGGTRRWDLEAEAEGPLPSRVMEVYAWALANQSIVNAIKGDARPDPGQYIRRGRGEFVNDRVQKAVTLYLLDTHHFQDELVDLMAKRVPAAPRVDPKTGELLNESETQVREVEGKYVGGVRAWDVNLRHDAEYGQHMAAMNKVTETNRGKTEQRWRPKREGMRFDLRMCEVYQVAGAFQTAVHLLPSEAEYMAALEAELARRSEVQKPEERRFATSDGRAFVASQR